MSTFLEKATHFPQEQNLTFTFFEFPIPTLLNLGKLKDARVVYFTDVKIHCVDKVRHFLDCEELQAYPFH